MLKSTESVKPPSWTKVLLEGRALYELGAMYLSVPWLWRAPYGDGHPVLVLPGFTAGDGSTLPLRTFLKSRGYAVHGWTLGVNLGQDIDPAAGGPSDRLQHRLRNLHLQYNRKVSLIGWSLGGLYARELARIMPEDVRLVITLASPFYETTKASRLVTLYEFLNRTNAEDISPTLRARMQASPPVPTTSIYSRTDGVADWRSCVEPTGELSENIEVEASHLGLGFHPLALWAIADRLAQEEGEWQPFQRDGFRRILYREPVEVSH